MDSPCIKQTVCKVLKIFQYGKYLVAYVLNFAIKSPWGRQSNALDRSINIAAMHSWLSKALRQSSSSLSRVDWQPKPFLKAAKKGLKLESRYSDS